MREDLDRASVNVHGDIRHLEMPSAGLFVFVLVHGDIRHLEITIFCPLIKTLVHGDIRHLETKQDD